MKVFISHSSVDKEFVRTLKKDLEANGINTWVDEDCIDLGDNLMDTLDKGINDSTHFIVILSKASTNSDWVKYELKEALKDKPLGLIKKIIPIKYNECEIPFELKGMLYGDLTDVTRIVKGDKVEFESPVYTALIDRLRKAIKNSEKQLTTKEIEGIRQEFSKTETTLESKPLPDVIRGVYQVNAYRTKAIKLAYASKVLGNGSKIDVGDVRPILLPALWRPYLKSIKLGTTIIISKNYLFEEPSQFAGFRKDDIAIALDGRVRKKIGLTQGSVYKVEYLIHSDKLNFIRR
jgi:TIR domain